MSDVYSWEADEAPLKQKEKPLMSPLPINIQLPSPALSAPPKGEVGGPAVEASFLALYVV